MTAAKTNDEILADAVRKVVDEAPPLTDAQRDLLRRNACPALQRTRHDEQASA